MELKAYNIGRGNLLHGRILIRMVRYYLLNLESLRVDHRRIVNLLRKIILAWQQNYLVR